MNADNHNEQPGNLIKSSNQFPVVGIGASAGGLDAFSKLLKAIPIDSGMAYVLVQHLDPNHESILPELLQRVTTIPVLEISDDLKVQPDHIYIIPSNKMLIANDGVLKLSPRLAKDKYQRNLPIDIKFNSLAEVHQAQAIGVVLSGTASDGTKGLKAIKDRGGITFAQDQASAEYAGMPRSAELAGVVDFILRPEEIPKKLLEIKQHIKLSDEDIQNISQQDEDAFRQILTLIRLKKATDFTYYKQTTIRRRIIRRMAIKKTEVPADYLKYLRENKTEQDALYLDLLIPVTSFFRDKKVFEDLCETVFPELIKNKFPDEALRVWVAGCSTGEEAYSMAICLREFLGDSFEKVQIFATDISEPAIAKARRGVYTLAETDGLTPERLNDCFIKTEGSYRIKKELKDMCIFAVHNFLKDPPFGKIDLVSCRNVLIYMEPYLQKKALTTFHYSLKSRGYLLLGKSETGTSLPDLFESSAKNSKIFSRRDATGGYMQVATRRSEQNLHEQNTVAKNEPLLTDFQRTADEILLSKYTPVGVVVNEANEIVHFRGNTSAYLEQLPGKPTHNLLKMAKEGLGFELRNIIHKAKKENRSVLKENFPLVLDGQRKIISVEAIPLPNMADPHYLIMFHSNRLAQNDLLPEKHNTEALQPEEKDQHIEQLVLELSQTREDMRSISEDQEAANEELQSANEELLSGSEELQSLNEELETSKEELQSINEELSVVNQEMLSLNEQVTEAKDYAEAIVATLREPLLVLDKNLYVKTATEAFYQTFDVTKAETEGKLIYRIGNGQWEIPELKQLLEDIIPKKTSIYNFKVEHNFENIGLRNMLLNAREIIRSEQGEKLILLVISDITNRVIAERNIQNSELRFRQLADFMPQKVWTADNEGKLNYFNKCWIDYTGLTYIELKDWQWKKVVHEDDWEEYKRKWKHSINTGENLEHEHRILKANGDYNWHLTRGLAQRDENNNIVMWIGTNTEIQEQKHQKKLLEEAVAARTFELEQANEELLQKNNEVALSKYNKRFLTDFSETFAGYKLHTEFFNSVVNYIADLTHLDYVLIGKLESTADNTTAINTIAFSSFGNIRDNITYPLADGPCNNVVKGITYSYPENCRKIFPESKILAEFNVEGFIGYPLYDAVGNAMGLIAVMHEGKIVDVETVSSVLKIVAKRAELELERIKYEDDLKKNYVSLAEKNEELLKMNKELESFTYISSHDLQEPLRKIQTFAGLILKNEAAVLSDAGADYFKRMTNAASRMQTLIEDLLAYSHTNITERKFVKSDLDVIIEDVKQELKELILAKNAEIDHRYLCVADVNPFQFMQVFSNLITNSLKFCKPGMHPQITITANTVKGEKLQAKNNNLSGKNNKLIPDQNYCHIVYSDNGIGFDPIYKDKIFEVFQRLHGKEEYEGTGIGLAIVKKIIENHNGIITATGELGKGATFDIYIPLTNQ